MSDAYRKDPEGDALGERERESDAVAAFGRWREKTSMLVALVFALAGVPLAALAWYLVQDFQFTHNRGRALLIINVAGAALVFGAMLMIAAFVGRRVLRTRAPAKLAQLAKDYDVPVATLQDTATMVDKL
jgi:hypothetical protein